MMSQIHAARISNGTTTPLSKGIAIKLLTGAIQETCWKKIKTNGNKAIKILDCDSTKA